MRRHRAGFTLVEMMMFFVMMTLIMAISVPRFVRLRTNANMRSAKDQMAAAIATARAAAIQKGRPARFKAHDDSIRVDVDTNSAGLKMVVVKPISISKRFGATLTLADLRNDSVVTFDPRGFGDTDDHTAAYYVLSLDGRTDTVCVTRFGRVTKGGSCQ